MDQRMDFPTNGTNRIGMSGHPGCDVAAAAASDLMVAAALRESAQQRLLSYHHHNTLVRDSALLSLGSGYGIFPLFRHSLDPLVDFAGTVPPSAMLGMGHYAEIGSFLHGAPNTMAATDPLSARMRLLAASRASVGMGNVGDLLMTANQSLNFQGPTVGAQRRADSAFGDSSSNLTAVAPKGPPSDGGIRLLRDVALQQLEIPEAKCSNSECEIGSTAPRKKNEEEEESDARKREKRIYRHESFVEKLYRLLIELEGQGKESIASFTPDGLCFGVHKPEEFIKNVVPKYFRHRKMSSFHRQLLLYKFDRVRDGPDRGSFKHKFFRRGHADLLKCIERDDKNDKLPIGYQKAGQRA